MSGYVTPSTLGSKINISLPLLVRDWLKKRCPTQECFHIREAYDLVHDEKNGIIEETLASLQITSKKYTGSTINSDGFGRVYSEAFFDYIIDIEGTHVYVEAPVFTRYGQARNLGNRSSRKLNWRAPSFWQQLGKVIKCPHKPL